MQHVTGINLGYNNLVGTLPAELGNLPQLVSLGLPYNQLQGEIPPELGNLGKLTDLGLNYNQLSGPLPADLSKLGELRYIQLQGNQLSGALPSSLGSLSKLQYLDLGQNQFTGGIPSWLGDLAALQYLALSGNQFTGPIPSELGKLTGLQDLFLQSNQLSGGIPSWLGNMTTLQYLHLSDNQLTGAIPRDLAKLTQLQGLGLSGNQLTGGIPPWVPGLTSLYYLALGGNPLGGTMPVSITNLTALQDLNLSNAQLTGPIPPDLGDLTKMQFLYLGDNQLTGSLPARLASMTELVYCYLDSNQFSGPIPSLVNLKKLWILDLSGNQLSGSISAELGGLTTLRNLVLRDNQLTGAIPPELGDLTNLTILDLRRNELTGPIPGHLGDLHALLYLMLGENHLTGAIPDDIGAMTGLWGLMLEGNQLTGAVPSWIGNLTGLYTLWLENNALEGEIPGGIVNLTRLYQGNLKLEYNRLVTADLAVIAFLDAKGPGWAQTQTVPPSGVQVMGETDTSAQLTWTPIAYTSHGGYYQVSTASAPGGPYTVHGTTADKTAAGYTAGGLTPGSTYYFAVQAFTPDHTSQQNALLSAYSQEVSATLTGGPIYVLLDPATVTTVKGGVFTLDLKVQAGSQPVSNLDLRLLFDPTHLQAVDAAGAPVAALVPDLGAMPNVTVNTVNPATGQIRYVAGKLGSPAPTGTFRVATVRFKALDETAGTDVSFTTGTEAFYGGALLHTVTHNAAVSAGPSCLAGQVTLQDHAVTAGYQVTVTVRPPGGGLPVATYDLALTSSGLFSVCDVPVGAFDVAAKGRHSVSSGRAGLALPTGTTPASFCTLLEGDANNDDRITGYDYSLLALAYGTSAGGPGFDPRADFNDDGQVGDADYALLAANYDQYGPVPCAVPMPAQNAGAVRSPGYSEVEAENAGMSLWEGWRRPDDARDSIAAAGVALLPATGVSVVLSPPLWVGNEGDIFTYDLMVEAGSQPLSNVELHLEFDPHVLRVVEASGDPAPVVAPDTGTMANVLKNAVDNVSGHIRYDAGQQLGVPAPSGTFRVATLRFMVVGAGQGSPVSFTGGSDVFYGGGTPASTASGAAVNATGYWYMPVMRR